MRFRLATFFTATAKNITGNYLIRPESDRVVDPTSFLILLIAALIILVALYLVIKLAKYLVINTILGLLILLLAHFLGIGVPINWVNLIISALAGIPGAILVILLYVFGIPL